MKTYYKLFLAMALAFAAVSFFLMFLGWRDLIHVFVANAITYFIVALFFTDTEPVIKTTLNIISAVVFAGFLAVVAFNVMEILSNPPPMQ